MAADSWDGQHDDARITQSRAFTLKSSLFDSAGVPDTREPAKFPLIVIEMQKLWRDHLLLLYFNQDRFDLHVYFVSSLLTAINRVEFVPLRA